MRQKHFRLFKKQFHLLKKDRRLFFWTTVFWLTCLFNIIKYFASNSPPCEGGQKIPAWKKPSPLPCRNSLRIHSLTKR